MSIFFGFYLLLTSALFFSSLENVAEGKQAAQTGTKDDYEAKFAVDGTVNQQTNYSHAFTRVENDTVWWEVVLGSVEKIQLVRVYFAKPGMCTSG